MTIPIANLYYLLLYAWNALDEAAVQDVTAEEHHELIDLLAKVLIGGTNDLIRRGIDRGYVTHEETIPGIRGSLLLTETLQRNLLQSARTHCAFDELSADVVHNQILKATFGRLSALRGMNRQLREEAGDIHQRLAAISDVQLAVAHFRRVQLHRNNAAYDLLLKVCRFLFDNLLVDEKSGTWRFRDFERDVGKMRRLFEAFALNFFRRHFRSLRVGNPQIEWYGVPPEMRRSSTLPVMQTDIVIRSRDRALIIDTKFTPKAFEKRQYLGYLGTSVPRGDEAAGEAREDPGKAQSGHLYQVFSYVTNYAYAHPEEEVSGMLLYPVVDEPFAARYELHPHVLEIMSVDLRRPWREIEGEMMGIVGERFGETEYLGTSGTSGGRRRIGSARSK